MMFFASPVAAMRNIAKALKPGGELVFVVWRPLAANPCLALAKETVLRFLPPPGEDGQSCGPGPFSMADPTVVKAQLAAAGFELVDVVSNDGEVMVGATVDQAIDFQLAIGPAGEIVREAGDIAVQRRPQIVAALRELLAPYLGPNGVTMPSSSWAFSARKRAA